MRTVTSFKFSWLIVAVIAVWGLTVQAQSMSAAYEAGADKGYIDQLLGQYGTADAAVIAYGYAQYGDEFVQGYLEGWFYSKEGYENYYAGAWELFSASRDNVEQERVISVQQTRQGSQRLARNFRRLARMPATAKAGEVFDDVILRGDYSYASVEDNILGGKGHDQESSIFLSSRMGDLVRIGLGYSHNRYDITSNGRGYEQTADALDAVLSLNVSDNLALGAFLNINFIDIEDEVIFGLVTPGDSFERWGGGLLAAWNADLGERTNFGLTTALASMNKSSVDGILDDEDTAWVVLLDLNQKLTDSLAVNLYGSYFGLMDRETTENVKAIDGSYWTWGSDFSLALGDTTQIRVGYETTASDNDHEEHRVNTSLTLFF